MQKTKKHSHGHNKKLFSKYKKKQNKRKGSIKIISLNNYNSLSKTSKTSNKIKQKKVNPSKQIFLNRSVVQENKKKGSSEMHSMIQTGINKRFFGFPWDSQSCWIDSSLMCMFFPTPMYEILYPMFAANDNPKLSDIKSNLMHIVDDLRHPDGIPTLHGLRDQLIHKIKNHTQEDAFQPGGEQGYVFYFLQEFLRIFDIPAITGKSRNSSKFKKIYIMEVEQCEDESISHCLKKNYKGWTFKPDSLNYMIIELIDHNAFPEEEISFESKDWKLTSMIVFDCSHFISYLKQGDQWYLYDDNRSLMHTPLKPYKFGQHYNHGMCSFEYGRKNTFFFYVPL